MTFLRKIRYLSNKNDNAALAVNVCYQKKNTIEVNVFFFDNAYE